MPRISGCLIEIHSIMTSRLSAKSASFGVSIAFRLERETKRILQRERVRERERERGGGGMDGNRVIAK